MNNFETIDNIQIITTKTNEEIRAKNLEDFIFTTLTLNNITIDEESKIYYIFSKETSSYQIFLSKNRKIPIFFSFTLLSNNLISLYYSKHFFCIYKNNKLIYLSKLDDEIKIEELKVYIEKKLNIKIELTKFYTENDLNNLVLLFTDENLKQLESVDCISKSVKNSFTIYLVYLLLLLGAGVYLFNLYNKRIPEDNNLTLKKNELILLIKKKNYKSVKYEINSLLSDLNKYKFTLSSLVYNKNKFTLVFYSKNKTKVFIFLKKYSRNIISNSIKYQESNRYENNIIIKFN